MSVCGTWRSRRSDASVPDRTGACGRVHGFPVKTLLINILGAFVIGVLAVLGEKHSLSPLLVLTLKTGVCGGFTTFSTFALETSQLFQNGSYGLGIGYVCASVILSIAACSSRACGCPKAGQMQCSGRGAYEVCCVLFMISNIKYYKKHTYRFHVEMQRKIRWRKM